MEMKRMKKYKKLIAVSAAALAMTAAFTLDNAMAYFTTQTEAGGSHTVSLGATTEIQEEVSSKTKHVTVVNTSESNECFVRVKVFSGRYVTCTPTGNNWTYDEEDGYWYYGPAVAPKGTTDVLDVSIQIDPAKEEEIKDFNVVVVQECTPVIYNEDGSATANWDTVYTGYEEEED